MKVLLNYPHLGILIIAWFVADLLLPLLIIAGNRIGILDRPGGHKGQRTPVPFFGGIGIFVAFTIAVCSTLRFGSVENFLPLMGILFGGAVVVTLGLLDDFRPINAVVKLSVLFLTTLVLAFFGIHLNLFPDVLYQIPNIFITLLWIAGISSATNSLDNTDGVAGGVAAIAGIFIFAIAWGTSAVDAQPWLSYLAAAFVGACFGFLRYNFTPARIYLGDNGSFFVGYTLATMLIFGRYSEDILKAILVPLLVLSVPIFDICLVTILRIRAGEVRNWKDAVVYCGRDHLAHLLMGLQLSKRVTTFLIYALAMIGGSAALLVMNADHPAMYLATAGIYGAFLFSIGFILSRVRRHVVRETHYLPRVAKPMTPRELEKDLNPTNRRPPPVTVQ